MRLIDADALYKDICDSIDQMTNIGVLVDGEYLWAKLQDALDNAPTIEPKRGKWIDEADKYDASFGIHDYRCSNCNSYADESIGGHEWYTMYKPNYCPYCGADMRGEDDE